MSYSLQPLEIYSPWDSPGQKTGVGILSLLQGSSQSRDQTRVSLIAGRFFKPMHFEKDLREPGLDEERLGWKLVCVKDKVLDQDKVS